jgi:hypothetical protein
VGQMGAELMTQKALAQAPAGLWGGFGASDQHVGFQGPCPLQGCPGCEVSCAVLSAP